MKILTSFSEGVAKFLCHSFGFSITALQRTFLCMWFLSKVSLLSWVYVQNLRESTNNDNNI